MNDSELERIYQRVNNIGDQMRAYCQKYGTYEELEDAQKCEPLISLVREHSRLNDEIRDELERRETLRLLGEIADLNNRLDNLDTNSVDLINDMLENYEIVSKNRDLLCSDNEENN
jgi:hypothetical protein